MFGKTEELIIVLLILLLLFGAKRLPDIAKGIGQAGREIRKGFAGDDDEVTQKSDSAKSEAVKKK